MDTVTLAATIVTVLSAATWWEAYQMRKFFENNVILVHIKEGERNESGFN